MGSTGNPSLGMRIMTTWFHSSGIDPPARMPLNQSKRPCLPSDRSQMAINNSWGTPSRSSTKGSAAGPSVRLGSFTPLPQDGHEPQCVDHPRNVPRSGVPTTPFCRPFVRLPVPSRSPSHLASQDFAHEHSWPSVISLGWLPSHPRQSAAHTRGHSAHMTYESTTMSMRASRTCAHPTKSICLPVAPGLVVGVLHCRSPGPTARRPFSESESRSTSVLDQNRVRSPVPFGPSEGSIGFFCDDNRQMSGRN